MRPILSIIDLRAPCIDCASTTGHVTEKNGQACVYCEECGRYQYNQPKSEARRAPRPALPNVLRFAELMQTEHDAFMVWYGAAPRTQAEVRARLGGCVSLALDAYYEELRLALNYAPTRHGAS